MNDKQKLHLHPYREFRYNTLDPAPPPAQLDLSSHQQLPPSHNSAQTRQLPKTPTTPVQIEEYSDLYDDYLDPPNGNNAAESDERLESITTINSSAAVYEQSTGPSQENIINDNIYPHPRLNIRNQSYLSDESLDSSFGHNYSNLKNNNSSTSFRTPKFNNENGQFDPLKTPIANVGTNAYFSTPPPIPITATIPTNNTLSPDPKYPVNSKSHPQNGNSSPFDEPNNNGYNPNDEDEGVVSSDDIDGQMEDDDEDYDEEETARLLLLQRQKNEKIYSPPTNGSSNDATIINNINGNVKVTKKGISDFKIGKELGEGSYSTVVLATDITNNKKYAIKILSKRHIIKEKKVKYVNIEKNALNRLGSRNGIVGLHYTFQDSANLYFVLDFAENGELLTLIKRFGTLSEASTMYYVIQLIDTVDYIHKNGIIHRDLKPENILVDKDLKLQITDFGTAKLLDKIETSNNYPNDTRATSFVGTAEYVSPELLNDKYCGKAADVWAMGCIIYQMIAGKPPFKATNEYLTFQKIQKLQYAFTAGFPIVIRDLIKRILVLKPRERLTINDIKNHYWFKDVNWNDQDSIWNIPPPLDIGPYKISAKSMKPVPELDMQYPNGSSTSIQNMKKKQQQNASASQAKKATQTKIHPPLSNPNSTNSALPTSLIATPSTESKSIKLPVASSSSDPKNRGQTTQSSATAAAAALNMNVKKTPAATANQKKRDNSRTQVPKLPSSTSNKELDSSPMPYPGIKLSNYELQQMTADRIIKSRQASSSSSSFPTANTANKNVDVIPGTNIPRPVLNTKIPVSRSNTGMGYGSKSRNNSSLKNVSKRSEVPQMSTLDLKWVQFIKHPDERILKAGIVDVIKDKSILFEKKYKGMLIESPLGYKNKDKLIQNNLFSDNDDESILIFDDTPDDEEKDKEKNESADNEGHDETSVQKFKKFFTVKPSMVASNENKFVSRTMIITTFGRCLLFHENYGAPAKATGSNNNNKYELTAEIDLTNSVIHFVEVVGNDRKHLKPNKGLFAIMSNSVTICCEVDKTEVSPWTQALANSRLLEKERKLQEFLNSSASPKIEGEETAFAAATLAANKSPEGMNASDFTTTSSFTKHSNANTNANNPLFPASLRRADEPKTSKLPTTPKSNTKKKSSIGSPQSPNSNSFKKTIAKNPMISAAINKAVSMASVNAAVGAKPTDAHRGNTSNDSPQRITQMNSKFLARSRMK